MEEKKENQISWRAAEREHRERGFLWYLIIFGGALVLFTIALFQKNFFFGVFVLFSACVVSVLGKAKPRVFNFLINEKGVTINERTTLSFDKLESFFFRNRPGQLDELILKKKVAVNPFVRIPIDEKTAEKAKKILEMHIPTLDYQDSLMDLVSDWLGF